MGRQTCFFMDRRDLSDFRGFIEEQNDNVIKEEPSKDFAPIAVGIQEELNEDLYYIYNLSLKISFRLNDNDLVKDMKIIEKFPKKDWDELIMLAKKRAERIGWLKDSDSEAIEFCPSKVIDAEKRITEGRIWVELYNFDENGQKYKRSEALESMYVKYAKYIKKKFKLDKNKWHYIGSGAYELYKNGWWMGDGKRTEQFKLYW